MHAVDGSRTMTEWVAGRLDVAPETAKDLVGAARSLADQPTRAAGLGDDTFDRVLATARLAAAGAPESQVKASRAFDIAGVRRLTDLHRRITRTDEHRAFTGRYLVFQPSLDGTTCQIRGQLPGDRAEATRQRLAAHADTYPTPPDGVRPSQAARMADALYDLTTTPTARPNAAASSPHPANASPPAARHKARPGGRRAQPASSAAA